MSKPIKQTKSAAQAKTIAAATHKENKKNRKTSVDKTPSNLDIDGGPIPLSAQTMRDLLPSAIYIPEEPFVALEFFDNTDAETSDADIQPIKPKKKNQHKKPKTAKAKIIKLKREELADGSPSPISSSRMQDLFRATD